MKLKIILKTNITKYNYNLESEDKGQQDINIKQRNKGQG